MPNQPKNINLLTASTRLVHGNYLYKDFSAHGKSPFKGLSATGPDREGGTCIFGISWPEIIHQKIRKYTEYACDRHEDASSAQLKIWEIDMRA